MSDSEQPEAAATEGDVPAVNEKGDTPDAETAVEQPKDDVVAETPQEEAAKEEPKEEVAAEEPEAEVAVEEPTAEVAVEEPQEQVPGEEPKDEANVEQPPDEGAVEQPKDEEATAAEATDEAVEQPKAEDDELTLQPVVGDGEGEEAPPKDEDELTLAPPVEEGEGEVAPPKDEDELTLAPPVEEGEGEVAPPKDEDELTLAPPVEEGEGEGEHVEGEGEKEGEGGQEGAADETVEGGAGEEGTEEGEGGEGGEEGEEKEKAEGEGEGDLEAEGEADKLEKEESKAEKKVKKEPKMMKRHRDDAIDDDHSEMEAEVGDFAVRRGSSSTEAFVFDPEVASTSSSEEEIEEEVEAADEGPEELKIDREAYTETYRQLLQERAVLRRKNALLQKKLVEHYKKRKMENVYKDVLPHAVDLEPRYAKKLLAYDDMRTIEERERFLVNTDLADMKKQRDALADELQQEMDALVDKERETGTGLINAKTGKPIPDKLIERFLRRQVNKCKDIAKCRLTYIKLRDKVTLKETALKDLETLGDNLHLIDYEQLRMENQNLTDKIEERDDELTRLRFRTTQCIQILAHIREKSHATLADIETQKDYLRDVEDDVIKTRAELNQLKRRRDMLREETLRNQEEAGLLTKPKLLRDFEESIDMVAIEQQKLDSLQKCFKEEAKALTMARAALVEYEAEYRNMRAITVRRSPGRRQFAKTQFAVAEAARPQNSQERDEEEEEPIFQMK